MAFEKHVIDSGLYYPDKTGRIISVKQGRPKPLKGSLNDYGYLTFKPHINGKVFHLSYARFIYAYFNGARAIEGKEVWHLNRIKSDNRLENLTASVRDKPYKRRLYG